MLVKNKIKQAFASAAQSYDEVADLQRQVGRELCQQLGKIPTNATLLDIGCGTGFMLTEIIDKQQVLPTHCIALDIAEPMLRSARKRFHDKQNITYICADAEQLPLQAQSVDIIVSNLALQWCQNLEAVLVDIRRIIKPGGCLRFTTFGAQTLKELKKSWYEVDNYQHVNDFYQAEEISDSMKRAGFSDNALTVTCLQTHYSSVYDLMAELKQLGAHTVINGQNPKLTGKTAMQRMASAYQQQMSGEMITATFEVITVIAEVK